MLHKWEVYNEIKSEAPKIHMIIPSSTVGLTTDQLDEIESILRKGNKKCMLLFSVICNQNKQNAWKSKKHADNTMFDDYFIVGINTPEGQFTYHYQLKYWDMFQVTELSTAPEYDGHTPSDITRLLSLLNDTLTMDHMTTSITLKEFQELSKSQLIVFVKTDDNGWDVYSTRTHETYNIMNRTESDKYQDYEIEYFEVGYEIKGVETGYYGDDNETIFVYLK